MKLFKGVQLSFPAAFIPTFLYVTVYDQGIKRISAFVDQHFNHESIKLVFPFFVSGFA